jgi:hypothetical protein
VVRVTQIAIQHVITEGNDWGLLWRLLGGPPARSARLQPRARPQEEQTPAMVSFLANSRRFIVMSSTVPRKIYPGPPRDGR